VRTLLAWNSKETIARAILAISLMISVLLSFSLVRENYYLLFFLAGSSLSIFLMRSKTLPIIIILLVVPFADWAVEKRYVPFLIMWFPEFLSGIIFIKALVDRLAEGKKIKTVGLRFVIVFLILVLSSQIFNDTSLVSGLLMLRLLFRYYLLLLATINLDLSDKEMRSIFSVMVFVFVLQLPLSVIKLFLYGPGENPLGLSSHALSTIVPLIAISFLYSFYFLHKKKTIYLLGIVSFVGFSIIGGKRAFIFYLIVLVIFLTWIFRRYMKLNYATIFLSASIVLVSFYCAARLLPTLNPQNKIWGNFDLKYIINFVINYETSTRATGLSAGRIVTTANAFNSLNKNGLLHSTLGFGPGIIIRSMFPAYDRSEVLVERFGIAYGVNGLVWLGIQVGYLGLLAFFLFLFSLLRASYLYFLNEHRSFWRPCALGIVGFSFVLLLTGMLYTPFFLDDSISAFYYCVMGLAFINGQYRENYPASAYPPEELIKY
jgi:hypothetical protein